MEKITSDNLPLDAREMLMRGRQDDAIIYLEEKYNISKPEAEKIITEYRSNLQERNLELEIKAMHDKSRREADESRRNAYLWGVRIFAFVLLLGILLFIIGYKH